MWETERKELQQRVRNALSKLQKDEQQILLLKYESDLSSEQIASTLNVSRVAARQRLMRAMREFEIAFFDKTT